MWKRLGGDVGSVSSGPLGQPFIHLFLMFHFAHSQLQESVGVCTGSIVSKFECEAGDSVREKDGGRERDTACVYVVCHHCPVPFCTLVQGQRAQGNHQRLMRVTTTHIYNGAKDREKEREAECV